MRKLRVNDTRRNLISKEKIDLIESGKLQVAKTKAKILEREPTER